MLFILLGTLLYFIISLTTARVSRKSIIDSARYDNGSQCYSMRCCPDTKLYTHTKDGISRTKVFAETRELTFAWPIYLPRRIMSQSLNTAIDRVDPEVYARTLKRNKQLERELGMAQDEHTYH